MIVTAVSKRKNRKGWTVYYIDEDEGTFSSFSIKSVPEYLYWRSKKQKIKRVK